MSFESYITESDQQFRNQLKKGLKVEKEHKDLYEYYTSFLKKHNIKNPLTIDEFAEYIAKSHLREISDYYDRLDDMENK
jgi:hypothetical protein